jgi:flagellar basal-body rod protein FlgB
MPSLDITNSGPMPALEMAIRFAGQRQRLLAHNIANIDTPNFQPLDVDPAHFQKTLADAIDDRRRRTGGEHGPLRWDQSAQLTRDDRGDLLLRPDTPSRNILFHDRNNRDVERMMQALAENTGAYRIAIDLMTHHTRQINNALAERVG